MWQPVLAGAAAAGCSVWLIPDVIEGVIDAARSRGIPIIVDPKGREYWRYQGATLVTPNRAELAGAVGHPINVESDIVDVAKSLVVEYDLKAVLVTRSQDGMTLVTADGEVTHLVAEALEVFDVSGAGDTVVATIAAAMAGGAKRPGSPTWEPGSSWPKWARQKVTGYPPLFSKLDSRSENGS